MPYFVRFLAVVFVYFAIVYLTAIRKGHQPIVPWLLLILLQAVSVYYHKEVYSIVRQMPFMVSQTDKFCKIVTVAILALVNLLAILGINMAIGNKEKPPEPEEKPKEQVEESNNVFEKETPVSNVNPEITPEEDTSSILQETPASAAEHEINADPEIILEEDMFPFTPELQIPDDDIPISLQTSDEMPDEVNIDDNRIFDTIQMLRENGNSETAIKYLRMVSFFGKDEQIVNKAKQMLNDLHEEAAI